jgi:hypothetical protein
MTSFFHLLWEMNLNPMSLGLDGVIIPNKLGMD